MFKIPQSGNNGLILQKKWEEIAVYIYTVVLRHMPRLDRNTLGIAMMQSVWRVEKLILQVAYRRTNRQTLLWDIDLEVKTILRMVALAVGMGSVPSKKYEVLAEKLVEIGKIVGGLLKKQ